MKKNKKEDDEEIRRAKANIRTGFIIAVIVIALLAVIAFVMVGLMSAITSGHGHRGDTGYRHIKQADIKLT